MLLFFLYSANLNEIENNQRNSVCKYVEREKWWHTIYTWTSKHMISIISFDSSDYGLPYEFYICYARTHTHAAMKYYDMNEQHSHAAHMWNAYTHVCDRARAQYTQGAHTHSDSRGKTSLFMSICVLDLIIWYVSMCVCCPIEVMAMNKDRKITTKMKWNEHKSQSSMAQEKMIYRLECLFSYSEW